MEIIKDAKNYINFGWAVLPLRGKIPATPHGVKDASKDYKQIEEWFSEPGLNIGVATGKVSGITVVDFDGELGKAAISRFGLNKKANMVSKTGKGYHFIFNYVPGLVNHVRVLPGVDIRNDNAYIVVYPSVHPDTRRMYNWECMDGPRPFPQQLQRVINLKCGTSKRKFEPARIIARGSRNNTLAQLMGYLKGVQSDEIAHSLLHAYNKVYCSPPLSEKEVDNIFNSLRKVAENERCNGD